MGGYLNIFELSFSNFVGRARNMPSDKMYKDKKGSSPGFVPGAGGSSFAQRQLAKLPVFSKKCWKARWILQLVTAMQRPVHQVDNYKMVYYRGGPVAICGACGRNTHARAKFRDTQPGVWSVLEILRARVCVFRPTHKLPL